MKVTFDKFKESSLYEKFMNENKGSGMISIRAYSANSAVPIPNLNVSITTDYDDYEIEVFNGETDSSGTIDHIVLPAPMAPSDEETPPQNRKYNIITKYKTFIVKVYDGVCTLQDIDLKQMEWSDM